MPADTALKRYSAMNISSPWRGLNVVPDVTIPAGERAAVMYLYAMAGAAPPDFAGNDDMRTIIGRGVMASGGTHIGWT